MTTWKGHRSFDKMNNYEVDIDDSSSGPSSSSPTSSQESLGSFENFDGFDTFLSELNFFCPSPPPPSTPTFSDSEKRRRHDDDDVEMLKSKHDQALVVDEHSLFPPYGLMTSGHFALNEGSLSPHDFIIYPKKSCQLVLTEAVYYLETIRSKFYDPANIDIFNAFMLRIEHPHGFLQHLPLVKDPTHPNRHYCSLMPKVPGQYALSVVLTHPPAPGHRHRVEIGSSFNFHVTQNYDEARLNSMKLNFLNGRPYLLQRPWGIAVDRKTNLIYAADRLTHSIIVFDSAGKIVNMIGRGLGNGTGQLYRPCGVAIDGDRLFVSDKDNHRISIFSTDGRITYPSIGIEGNKDGELFYPWGIAISPKGDLLAVCDSRNFRLQLFDTVTGSFLRMFTVFQFRPFEYKKEFYFPRGVVFDNNGDNLYVTDFNLHTVFKLDVGLTSKTTFFVDSEKLNRPQGLAIDEAGNVLICDTRKNCIRVVDPDGHLIGTVGGTGKERFVKPIDMAVLNGGQFIVVDSTGMIQIF